MSSPQTAKRIRPEIQALRALAVLLVVAYHLWPMALPGGFIGVDVFFVISGFLITAHMLREVSQTGTVKLTQFWARRIRRLLPAAFTVLAASFIATLVWLPKLVWQQSFQEIGASALYGVNWLLAFNSTDYLAAENEPSIVQHYWSLSAEEQFYFAWPLLILVAIAVASWLGRGKDSHSATQMTSRIRAIAIILAIVFAASLLFSIVETARSQPMAFFVTTTRVWEFAAGGLLAFIPATALSRFSDRTELILRLFASWVGLAAILAAAFSFTAESLFPGYIALLPVIGTVLLIWAGNVEHRWAPTSVVNFGPVQLIGDLSYSIYLWHWPLIIVYPYIRGNEPGFMGGLLLIGASVALAALTKYLIEDPVRTRQFWTKNLRRSYVFAAGGMSLLVLLTTFNSLAIKAEATALAREAEVLKQCLGAALVMNYESVTCAEFVATEDRLFPPLAAKKEDSRGQYGCYVELNSRAPFKECTLGDPRSEIRIAITGDSHAASLVPGLVLAAEKGGWAIDVLVGTGCQLVPDSNCAARDEFKTRIMDGDYDLVLATGRRLYQPKKNVVVEYWEAFADAGITLIPIVDVPVNPNSTEACMEKSAGVLLAASSCGTSREEALFSVPDVYGDAGVDLGLAVINMTDVFCDLHSCPAVIGNAIVYRDTEGHITATFSRSLAMPLYSRISELIDAQNKPAGAQSNESSRGRHPAP